MDFRVGKFGRAILSVCFISFLLVNSQSFAITKSTSPQSAEKIFELDGDVVHNIGTLHNNVTNWGLVGSAPTVPSSFSHAPSGRWPNQSGTDFLWAGGLWVGAILNGVPTVSTGGYRSVLFPSEALEDSIHFTYQGDEGGTRFPWPHADDDDDGLVDEDPINSLDDDGDGLVDEDFAAISEQHFRCVMRDDTELAQESYPDHNPLGLSIVQESYQWSNPLINNAIGYEFTITNVGNHTLDDVYLGMFGDFDVGGAEDDLAGFWEGDVEASNGELYHVAVAYMKDGDESIPVAGLEGWVLLGHTTDSSEVSAPAQVGVHGYQDMRGNAPFNQGGDPNNDQERYEALSEGAFDGASIHPNDHRVLSTSGPFSILPPGGSLKYQVALVAGLNLEDLKINAAEMVACFQGREFDHSGQPVLVNWIPLSEDIVDAGMGYLLSQSTSEGLQINIETNISRDDGLVLIRRSSANLSEKIWRGTDFIPDGYSSGRLFYQIIDSDQGPGPRQYDLVQENSSEAIVLDYLEFEMPDLPPLSLTTSPNPFNPNLEIKFVTQQEGPVMFQVFDMRGHLVRTLLDELRPAGEGIVVWDGRDNRGQTLSSGVYSLKMVADGVIIERRVSLVK